MKIRAITTGFNLKTPFKEGEFRKIADFTNETKEIFEKEGYFVQTIRATTQPWEEYFESKEQIIKLVPKFRSLYTQIGTSSL